MVYMSYISNSSWKNFFIFSSFINLCLLSILVVEFVWADNNIYPPINISGDTQTKQGALIIGSDLNVNGLSSFNKLVADTLIIGNYPNHTLPQSNNGDTETLRVGVKDEAGIGGNIGAEKFCDSSGKNCFSAQEIYQAIESCK